MIAWLIPLLIVISSDVGILYRIRYSDINIVLKKKRSMRPANSNVRGGGIEDQTGRNGSEDIKVLPHVSRRVRLNTNHYNMLFDFFYLIRPFISLPE